MRRIAIRLGLAVAFVAAGVALSDAQAQSLLDQLRPNPMSRPTRGLRSGPPVAAVPEAPAPVAAPIQVATPPAPHAPARPPAPRPTQVASAAPVAPPSGGGGQANLSIEFVSGSDVFVPSATAKLDELGRAMTDAQLMAYRFRIEGHTDTVGSAQANKDLSERRARAVMTYLTTKFHVDPARLDVVGLGQDDLLVPTPPQTPEPRNRRVHVVTPLLIGICCPGSPDRRKGAAIVSLGDRDAGRHRMAGW